MSSNCVLAAVLLLAQLPAPATPTIVFQNTYGEQLKLFFRLETGNDWLPPIPVPRTGPTLVTVVNPGKHFIVIRDLRQRDERLGWYDLRQIAKVAPGGTVYLDSIFQYQTSVRTVTKYEYESRELAYTICKPVWETRSYQVTVRDPVTGESRIETRYYKVCKMVPEERTRTVQIKVPVQVQEEYQEAVKVPALKVMINGQLVPLNEILQRQ